MTFSEVEQRVAALIVTKLKTGLTHPGDPANDRPALSIPLLTFRTAGMHEELAKAVTQTTDLIGEAIVYTIQADGDTTIVDNTELARLRDAAALADSQPANRIAVTCRGCGNTMFTLPVKGGHANVDGPTLLSVLSPGCPHT